MSKLQKFTLKRRDATKSRARTTKKKSPKRAEHLTVKRHRRVIRKISLNLKMGKDTKTKKEIYGKRISYIKTTGMFLIRKEKRLRK